METLAALGAIGVTANCVVECKSFWGARGAASVQKRCQVERVGVMAAVTVSIMEVTCTVTGPVTGVMGVMGGGVCGPGEGGGFCAVAITATGRTTRQGTLWVLLPAW